MSLSLVGIVWFALNVAVVMLLLSPADRQHERLIVSFPGAWVIVGLPTGAGVRRDREEHDSSAPYRTARP